MKAVGWLFTTLIVGHLSGWLLPPDVAAIVVRPSSEQVAQAVERGRSAAAARTPPDRLYAWFGSEQDLQPRGFLMTKMAGLAVMSTHFALRSEQPAESDIRQILDEPTMLVSVTIFGDRPNFARDAYLVMVQGGRSIKPTKVRFDGTAARTSVWPKAPAFKAKVVATFAYDEFDPTANTTLSIFPAAGGEISFALDFAQFE